MSNASTRLLVLAPTFGEATGAAARSLAQLRELGFDTRLVDLRSGVRRVSEVATSEIGPLASRLMATAEHELAGDADVRLGFLGQGPLGVVAGAAGARTSRTDGIVALFPDRDPLFPSSAPALVIADHAPSGLGELQRAWGEAARIVLAPRGEGAADDGLGVRAVLDPVSRLVADFAAEHIVGQDAPGLLSWMRGRGVLDQYPLTAMERRRLIARLQKELVGELKAAGVVGPNRGVRVARIAALLAGLGAAQLSGAFSASASTVSTYNAGQLNINMIGADDGLVVTCSTSPLLPLLQLVAVNSNQVNKSTGPGPSNPVTCDEVTAIVVRDQLNTNLVADIDLNLGNFDNTTQSAVGTPPVPVVNPHVVDVQIVAGKDKADHWDVDVTGWVNVHADGAGKDDVIDVNVVPSRSAGDADITVLGGDGNDAITVGDVAAQTGIQRKIDLRGGAGIDQLHVGDLVASGAGASIDLDIRGSAATRTTDGTLPFTETIVVGGILATRTTSLASPVGPIVDVDIFGGTGTADAEAAPGGNRITVGAVENPTFRTNNQGIRARGHDADVDVDIFGQASGDEISVGHLSAIGLSAELHLEAFGADGEDELTVGPVRVATGGAVEGFLHGGEDDDKLALGAAEMVNRTNRVADTTTTSGARLHLHAFGNEGDDLISVGSHDSFQTTGLGDSEMVAVRLSGIYHDLELSVDGGLGSDVLEVGAIFGDLSKGKAVIDLDGGGGHDGSATELSTVASTSTDAIHLGAVDLEGKGMFVDIDVNGRAGADEIWLAASRTVPPQPFTGTTTGRVRAEVLRVVGGGPTSTTNPNLGLFSLEVTGAAGNDDILIGDVTRSGVNGQLLVGVDGGRGSDGVFVGDVEGRGDHLAVTLHMGGGTGEDALHLGNVGVSGERVALDIEVAGGADDDVVLVGATLTAGAPGVGPTSGLPAVLGGIGIIGTSARLCMEVLGSEGSDRVVVGEVNVWGSNALALTTAGHMMPFGATGVGNPGVKILGDGGPVDNFAEVTGTHSSMSDRITVGDLHVSGAGAQLGALIAGSFGDDSIVVGVLEIERDARLAARVEGGSGADLVNIGVSGLAAQLGTTSTTGSAPGAHLDLDVLGSSGSDRLLVGDLVGAHNGATGYRPITLDVFVSGSDGNDTISIGDVSLLGRGNDLRVKAFGGTGVDDMDLGDVRLSGRGAHAGTRGTPSPTTGSPVPSSYCILFEGGDGADDIHLGHLAADDRALLRAYVAGSGGDDVIAMGNLSGLGADVDALVRGGTGKDDIKIGRTFTTVGLVVVPGRLFASNGGANVDLDVAGSSAEDHISILDVEVENSDAGVDVDIWGGGVSGSGSSTLDAADTIIVGDIRNTSSGPVSLMIHGSNGADDIQVGDALVTKRGVMSMSVWGDGGDDAIKIGNLSGIDGLIRAVALGGSGDDDLTVGNILGDGAMQSVTLWGSTGADEIHVGDVLAKDFNGEAKLHVWPGESSTDTVSVGDVVASNSHSTGDVGAPIARLSINSVVQKRAAKKAPAKIAATRTVSKTPGVKKYTVGSVRAIGMRAATRVAVKGAGGNDTIDVAKVQAAGTSAWADVVMHGSLGDDLIRIGGLDVGFSAWLDVTVVETGTSSGADTLTIGALSGVRAAGGGELQIDVEMGSGDDLVRLLGALDVAGGSVRGPLTSSLPMFSGGDHDLGDTLSYAATYASLLGITDPATFTGNAQVQAFEFFRVVTPPPTGGGGGGGGGGVPAGPTIFRPAPTGGGTYGPQSLGPGDTLSTDTNETGEATPTKKAIVNVTLPEGGTATIGEVTFVADHVDESVGDGSGVSGDAAASEFGVLQIDLDITRAGDLPASIELILDPTMFSPGADLTSMAIMLNGVVIPDCPATGPNPQTCITSRRGGVGDDFVIVIETTHNSVLSFAVAPTNQLPLFCDPRDDGRARYADTPTSSPHKLAIECLADAGVIQGTSEFRFSPSGQLTRAQAASVIVRAADVLSVSLPTGENDQFSDVDGGGPHGPNIQRLAASGIIAGFDDGTFRGGVSISRAQFAVMMTRLFEVATGTRPATVDVFSDDDGTFLEQFMNEAGALGLIQGVAPETGAPGNQISRAQAASIIARFAGRLVAAGF